VIFIENIWFICEYSSRLPAAEQPAVSSGPSPITAVVAFSKGFACASGQSVVHLFEKSEEKDYRKTREIQVCTVTKYSCICIVSLIRLCCTATVVK